MRQSHIDTWPGLKAKQTAAKTVGDKKKTQDDLSGGMKQLTVEPIKVKSKNLDVVAEYQKSKEKKAANFVVIGMIDSDWWLTMASDW